MRLSLNIAGMFVFGAVALAIPAWLFEVRTGQPIQPEGLAELAAVETLPLETDETNGRLEAQARKGLFASIAIARSALQQDERSDAMRALDGAMRAAGVMDHALANRQYRKLSKDIEEARHAVQNGQPNRAVAILTRTSQNFPAAETTARQPSLRNGWKNATVIDARGVRLGELVAIADDGTVVISQGLRDVFGFLDLSTGPTFTVAIERLLVGKRNRFQNLTVMLPGGGPAG